MSAFRVLYAILTGLVLSSVNGVYALDMSVQPQLRLGLRATDNVRWASNDKESALGFDNGGGAILKAETADWRSIVTPSFNFRRFVIGDDLNADEYGVRTQHEWAATERLKTSLNVDYVRDSTLTTELTDAGRQNDVANRETIAVQPSVVYLLDERTSLNGGFLYQDVTFSTASGGRLVDY
ncbi:MAG: hypothetical protein AB7O50_17315, partial [Pseudolabrys sp.]